MTSGSCLHHPEPCPHRLPVRGAGPPSGKGVIRELEGEIDRLLPQQLVVDCAGVTFMDSAGIAILLRLWQRMEELGGSIHIRDLPEQPGRVFRAAGLARLIPTEPIPERSDA